MKNLMLFIVFLLWSSVLVAQTWKTEIYRADGEEGSRTLKLKPDMHLKVTTLLEKTDSTKKTLYFEGRFVESTGDSIRIRVTESKLSESFTSGKFQQVMYTGKYYDSLQMGKDMMTLALPDVDLLRYQKKFPETIAQAEDVILFSSLALLLVSPFICYNYKEGEFNEDLYQYFGLGCTAGIIVGFGLQFAGGSHELIFDNAFKSKKKKVWTFEK